MHITVGQLTEALLGLFPAADALDDDRLGLQVGDPGALVSRVGVALDPTVDVIGVAATLGCQALVCHHPAYWYAPREFVAAGEVALLGGAAAFEAARAGVAIIALHTNLDAAPRAREMLLAPLGYRYAAPLQLTNLERDAALLDRDPLALVASLGQLGVPAAAALTPAPAPASASGTSGARGARGAFITSPDSPFSVLAAPGGSAVGNPASGAAPTLAELARRCATAFGAVAKVWGDPEVQIDQLAVCSGAGGSLLAEVVASSADCYLTGELHHHQAIALAGQGIAAIELGHDISELPYRAFIAAALRELGFSEAEIVVLEPSASWWTPVSAPSDSSGDLPSEPLSSPPADLFSDPLSELPGAEAGEVAGTPTRLTKSWWAPLDPLGEKEG